MKSVSAIRKDASNALKGYWGIAMLMILICFAIHFISRLSTVLYIVAIIFLLFPLWLGATKAFLNLAKQVEKPSLKTLFAGFSGEWYLKSVELYLLKWVYTTLWGLLFIIPGVIKYLAFSQSTYIALENPHLTASEVLDESERMMKGHKWQLFWLNLPYWISQAFIVALIALPVALLILCIFGGVLSLVFPPIGAALALISGGAFHIYVIIFPVIIIIAVILWVFINTLKEMARAKFYEEVKASQPTPNAAPESEVAA